MIEMGVIPAGTILWHGTGAEKGFRVPDGPAWFSDARHVALHFAWLHGGWGGLEHPQRILKFVVTTDIELPFIENPPPRIRDMEAWGKDPWQRFVREFNIGGKGDDVERFSNRVCRHGYNGWRVIDNYAPGDDIMLCDPSRWVRRVQSGLFWRKR